MENEYEVRVFQVLVLGCEQWRGEIRANGHVIAHSNWWKESYARDWVNRKISEVMRANHVQGQ